MLLLDTNVVSELRKFGSSRIDPNVAGWAVRMRPWDAYISAITVLELELGVLRIERRDAAQGSLLRRWLEDTVWQRFSGRILDVDAAVAKRCASLHIPDPRSERDALIAATVLTHGLVVVTRNTEDFKGTAVEILNPWSA